MTDAPDVDDRRDTPLADQPASLGETPTLVFQGDDTTREPQTTGLIGQVIDARYRVLERLAGDDGAVYLAEHMRLSKQVVLKTISATAFGRDDAFARFEREARVTAVLDHPHIVCVMDYGRLDDGGAYLITQLVRGSHRVGVQAEDLARQPAPVREVRVGRDRACARADHRAPSAQLRRRPILDAVLRGRGAARR